MCKCTQLYMQVKACTVVHKCTQVLCVCVCTCGHMHLSIQLCRKQACAGVLSASAQSAPTSSIGEMSSQVGC